MKKPYITLEEALAAREEGRRSIKFLTEANGCINGCCSGVTICSETEFNPEPGFHDDQEGFFVLEGNGFVYSCFRSHTLQGTVGIAEKGDMCEHPVIK